MSKTAFQEKLDVLQVQRAEIFQDSLDELPSHINDILEASSKKEKESPAQTTKVLNEDGQLLEVIFDPVLKCYYEPT